MRDLLRKVSSQEVSKRTTTELEYGIPDGKYVRVDRFCGGHEYTTKDVRLELVVRDGSTDTILAVGYAENFDMRDVGDATGNGTKKIVIRLINNGSGTLHMTGIWEGMVE